MLHLPLALVVAFLAAAPLSAQTDPALDLVGTEGAARVLTATDLAGLPQVEVTTLEEGVRVTYRGPALRELATLAGAPTGRGLRGPAMALVLLLEAADGYVVGLMLSEIDAQFGAREAIVASSRNGEPLAEGDGPLRVVLPEDEFHARWVRQLARISLVQLAADGSAPGLHR